jgi:hypothetical protein
MWEIKNFISSRNKYSQGNELLIKQIRVLSDIITTNILSRNVKIVVMRMVIKNVNVFLSYQGKKVKSNGFKTSC